MTFIPCEWCDTRDKCKHWLDCHATMTIRRPAQGEHCLCRTPNLCRGQRQCERERERKLIEAYREGLPYVPD